MNPIVLAIPVFILLMLLEYWLMRRQGKSVYRFHETLGNIYCGMGQLFVDALFKLPLIALYALVLSKTSSLHLNLENRWLHYGVLFIVIDLIFYLNHRLCHTNKWLWAIHGVHHQSEDYNYSVGLRMPWWHKVVSFWTPLPLALMGFSIQDYILVISGHAAIQIWTHTQVFEKRIPIFEWFFVTPSHHRVHHGKNKRYIDKNFAGVLSIWDYLFKSYEPESEKVVFGVHRVQSHTNPVNANLIQFFPKLIQPIKRMELTLLHKTMIASSSLLLIIALTLFLSQESQFSGEEKFLVVLAGLSLMAFLGSWVDRGPSSLGVVVPKLVPRLGLVSMLVGLLILF
jgi:alkylglycerol monooxygenase